jgi:hypothetical protein
MMSLLISALFAASGVYAALAIAATWRRYGPAVLALRGELASCGDELREVCFRVSGYEKLRPTADVVRPDFSRPQFTRGSRPGLPQAQGWRAAA